MCSVILRNILYDILWNDIQQYPIISYISATIRGSPHRVSIISITISTAISIALLKHNPGKSMGNA